MPMTPTNGVPAKVLPFSISSLSAYETCPRRYYLTKIAKVVHEAQTEATIHGNAVHRALELAVKGEQGLPAKYSSYQPIVSRVLASPGVKQAERSFALNAAFKPVDYWANDAWVRGKIDLTVGRVKSALALDWKTGKPKQDDNGQLALTAAAIFAEKPYLETVRTGYVWLAHDKLDVATFARNDVPTIWQGFLPRVKRMQNSASSGDFPPKPSGLCRQWCPVGKKHCDFCGV